MKKKIFVLFFILYILFLSKETFASTGTYNYDTSSFTSSTIDYVKNCNDLVEDYVVSHNIDYTYYFIFYHSGSTGNLNDNNVVFKILLFNNNVYVSTNSNGVLNGDGMTYCFDFKTGEDLSTKTIKAVSVKAHAAFSGFRVLWTNYEQGTLVSKNEFVFLEDKMFYLKVGSNNFDYPQILSKNFLVENYSTYHAYICLENVGFFTGQWFEMEKEEVSLDNSEFIFYYNIYENGNYHIRLFDDSSGLYLFDDYIEVTSLGFDIILEPAEDTDKPIIAKTNEFSYSDSYLVKFSTDKEEWISLNNSRVEPEEDGSTIYGTNYFWTRIFKNGTYYFNFIKFIETVENGHIVDVQIENYYVTKVVDNIMVEDYMSDDYIFKPIISLDFNDETDSFVIRTQSILLDKALNLKCFYTTDFENNDITTWFEMDIDFENNIYMDTSDGFFYFEIPVINATDTDYHIAFYNYFSKKSSEIILYEFRYQESRDYIENNLDVHLGLSVQLNDFLKSVEEKFGVLGFPIQVVRNFCIKIAGLKEEEPIITIPELYAPIGNYKILNSTSYNFNSMLTSDSVIFVHEFYLTIVDMFFIYLLLGYLIKTLKSFISKE